jgi:HNH endonuclease
MNWKQIDKNKRIQNKGTYSAWKQQIANECYNQCVYCSIHENPWGGIDHYHIDHFRPQSKFKALKDIITNLYYACPICNKFKSDDWPNEPVDLSLICYPDPSDFNYTDLFTIDITNHTLEGKHVSANYLINRLYLNRPQLVYERRETLLNLKLKSLIAETTILIQKCNDNELKNKAFQLIGGLTQFLLTRSTIPPYKLVEIKKPKKKKAQKK